MTKALTIFRSPNGHSRLLSPDQVRAIRRQRQTTGDPYKTIAAEFKISHVLVWKICNNIAYRDIV